MEWQEQIERVSGVCSGKPIFRGTRITVAFVLERLAAGEPQEELIRSYPGLTEQHIQSALAYAAALVRDEAEVLA
jgi:uncharacterized protein (DUF433 family)